VYYVELPGGDRLVADVQNVTEATAWGVGDRVRCWLPPEAFHLVADQAAATAGATA
jgi:hypothetical protein